MDLKRSRALLYALTGSDGEFASVSVCAWAAEMKLSGATWAGASDANSREKLSLKSGTGGAMSSNPSTIMKAATFRIAWLGVTARARTVWRPTGALSGFARNARQSSYLCKNCPWHFRDEGVAATKLFIRK